MGAITYQEANRAQFGGDPNHVVVRGSNAGAGFITLLLTAYGGRNDGLFHAIAAGSQSFAATNTINQSQFAYDNLVIRTGCARSTNTLNCLRNLDAGTL
ncbi:alpha/beta-hydrolase [Penicillium atrosanguineum]|nr:alpha/beta-hydrolase [Penicillium atrosanguineum]